MSGGAVEEDDIGHERSLPAGGLSRGYPDPEFGPSDRMRENETELGIAGPVGDRTAGK